MASRQLPTWLAVLLVLVGAGVIVGYYWYEGTYFVRPEAAYLSVPHHAVRAPAAGRILTFRARPGERVASGAVLGVLETSAGAADLIARTGGAVLAAYGTRGETVAAGQVLAYVGNPDREYVEAWVSEDRLAGVRVGMPARVSFPALPGRTFRGAVQAVERTSVTGKSPLLPTPGPFSSRTQWVPVRIALRGAPPLAAGLSARVSILLHGGGGA
ncbi:MAG: HlyD family efflux transporter periplasmic adaptor subunit [Thermaerobacter sp.]|nr:HlyD family efflux transporter periplasmic adaptor subunit [Thermaerobacter sp.]